MSVLRNALRANGIFSVITGTVAFVFASTFSEEMAVVPPVLHVVGGGVAVFGLAILWATRRPDVDLRFGVSVVVADVLWVVGAVAILVLGLVESGWILGLVTLPVLVFAILQSLGVVRATREAPGVIATDIDIAAAPETVWSTLTDFDGYRSWNPFIGEGSGEVGRGGRLQLRMTLSSGRSTTVRPTITRLEEPHLLEWLGSIGVPGVFDGRHRFELEATATGTRLRHREEFSGLLVPLTMTWLAKETSPQFEAMNHALKARIEEGMRTSH